MYSNDIDFSNENINLFRLSCSSLSCVIAYKESDISEWKLFDDASDILTHFINHPDFNAKSVKVQRLQHPSTWLKESPNGDA